MADLLYSHSPQVSDAASPGHHAPGPLTPVHSPHHSVHSSASLRTPLHTLSIHEYRKQQNTPLARTATPSGKTLRRKAAASALNEIERAPSTKLTQQHALPSSSSSSRSLRLSSSAHQLASQPQFVCGQPVSDRVLRSQSAEPRTQGGSISSVATANSHGKARQFGSRKRLPRPPAPTGSELHPPSHVPVRPTQQIRAALPASLISLVDEFSSSDLHTTPSPSTFSLSRFPQPPHFETPRETLREKAVSFAPAAPVTPPATPATIHYRGASFDLLNPHASLQYHDIVTPSRDFDSSELLPLRTEQEPLSIYSEMAPKRPLYGDLSAAHAGILRCTQDPYSSSIVDLPLPPTPAAISPGSSAYTSPLYSPKSHLVPSPLATRKAPDESRFSLKQLTRTLTKRLGKTPEKDEAEELQQFQERSASGLSVGLYEEPLRPLDRTYIPAGSASYLPISPVSPTSPTSPASAKDLGSILGDDEDEIEYARRVSCESHDLQGLTSILPDDPSTQIGRANNPRASVFAMDQGNRPYYDDLASIYASSSIYTGDDHRKSAYQQSLTNNRESNPFLRYSGMSTVELANEYSYNNIRTSRPISKSLTQELYHRPVVQGDGNTDTISKFIDQYDPGNTTINSLSSQGVESANTSSLFAPYISDNSEEFSEENLRPATCLPKLGQLKFDLGAKDGVKDMNRVSGHAQQMSTRERVLNREPGLPPVIAAPLASAFRYDQPSCAVPVPELSEMFSNRSYTSYGDTQNLLQLPQSRKGKKSVFIQGLQPSSSYSQAENKALQPSSSYSQAEGQTSPQTPQEALDEAELIFDNAATEGAANPGDIPELWGRRSSVNLLRTKRLTDGSVRIADDEKADWETITGNSQQDRMSLDSIADYSSSEGSRDSVDVAGNELHASWIKQNHARGPSNYSHPSPLRTHPHPFSSSPPRIASRAGPNTVSDMPTPKQPASQPASPPASSTAPIFCFSTQPRRAVDEPYAFAPWADPYALSDKETQELLASGPNDDIIFDSEAGQPPECISHKFRSHERLPESGSPRSADQDDEDDNDDGLCCENTSATFTAVGSKGNLMGTQRRTVLHDAGSSLADTSSPGAKLGSSVGHRSPDPDYNGFYACPFPVTGSVTRIRQSRPTSESQHERSPSEISLFPSPCSMEPVQGSSPLARQDLRKSLRCSTTFKPARRASRAAVPGQTKLRQMVLAPDARTTILSQETHFSPFVSVSGSGRPSTSDTATPLHPTHPSLDTFPTIRSGKTILAHQHSPHLLCPEREIKEEDEVRRKKLSWLIFACFCILPPCIFLYRMWGDSIIVSVTNGDLGHCTAKSKRVAFIAGVVVNIGLITAILVPILVAQALKAI